MVKHRACMALVLVGTLALTLAACGRPAAGEPVSDTPHSAASSAVQSGAVSAPAQDAALPQDTKDGANAMQKITPPYEEKLAAAKQPAFLPEDLRRLYDAAFFLMRSLMVTTGFQLDYDAQPLTLDNGMQYYPDSGFATYSAFRAALDATFTQEYTDELLNESQAYVDDGNDMLYSLGAGRGGNIFYKGCDFALADATEAQITITMTGHYAEEMDDDGKLSEAETTEEYTLRLVKTDAGWRFSAFALPF